MVRRRPPGTTRRRRLRVRRPAQRVRRRHRRRAHRQHGRDADRLRRARARRGRSRTTPCGRRCAAAGLPAGTVSLVRSPARAAGWALFDDRRLALAVARGSGAAVAQLGAVARQAGTPVSLHGTGGAWLVAGESADAERFRLRRAALARSQGLQHAQRVLHPGRPPRPGDRSFVDALGAAAARRDGRAPPARRRQRPRRADPRRVVDDDRQGAPRRRRPRRAARHRPRSATTSASSGSGRTRPRSRSS